LEEGSALKSVGENPASESGFTRKAVRRDPESGQFVSPGEPVDQWEQQFDDLERLLQVDFT
jgi:hypothetical protein